jgi:hypothetical protein
MAPLWSLAELVHVPGESCPSLPCLQQLDLKCAGVVTAIIIYNVRRGLLLVIKYPLGV